MGAHDIDIDTEAGWARFAVHGTPQLDFVAVADTLCDANYKLQSIEIETHGEIVHRDGTAWLVLPTTGQSISIDGLPAPSEPGPVHGMVTGWAEGNAKLKLE